METKNFEIVGTESNIDWIGRKVTGAHNGTIDIKNGNLIFNHDLPIGGNFIIDTTSIKILDIADPATNAQFGGHLASDDFFSSEKYPEAFFEITSVTPQTSTTYNLSGNLTIKGITQPISFEAAINDNGETLSAQGKITVDRTKFNMKFRSGNFFTNLGDTLIYNNFELDVKLSARLINEASKN
jgi:hypothetical protein